MLAEDIGNKSVICCSYTEKVDLFALVAGMDAICLNTNTNYSHKH